MSDNFKLSDNKVDGQLIIRYVQIPSAVRIRIKRWFNNLVKYSNIHALHTETIKYAINHGCPARATIHVTDVDEENVEKTEYTLIKVSHPQHHITHLPDHINIIADQILVKMKEGVETF